MTPAKPCHGMTKRGQACKAHPVHGSDYCRRHIPAEASDTSDANTGARNEAWDRQAFLGAFEYTGMVSEACRMVGIARSTAYLERQRSEEFALAWHDVEEKVVDKLEAEAFRRAHDGVQKPIVQGGEIVTHVNEYSDSLLMFLLKAKRPERYRERVDVKHAGEIAQSVRVDLSKLSDEQVEQLERIAAQLEE